MTSESSRTEEHKPNKPVVSILQISDIHRAPNAPTSNTTQLGKLFDDIRYTFDEDDHRSGPEEPN